MSRAPLAGLETLAQVPGPADAPAGAPMQAGNEAFRRGALESAAAEWLAAAEQYAADGQPGPQADALARAAQARGALGFASESQALLRRALEVATPTGDAPRIGAILGALARSHLDLGDPGEAEKAIEEALRRAREAGSPGLEAIALYARGDLDSIRGDAPAAADAYGRSAALAERAGDARLAAQASASAARASIESGRLAGAGEALSQVMQRAEALPDSDSKAQLMIHAGRSYERLGELQPGSRAAHTRAAAAAFTGGLAVAERAAARRSASFALGYLGALHERAGKTGDALALTRRAVAQASVAGAPEALYRWHWQMGRLLRAEGRADASLDAYRRAVRTLTEIRSAAAGGLSFQEAVEPVFFSLVDLLLKRASATADPAQRAALLTEARDQLEELKSVELTDYFQDACLAPRRETQAAAIPGAVIIYPVILPDRTEFLVSQAGSIQSVVVPIAAAELEPRIRTFRELLQKRTTREYLTHAAELYDLLMRPLEAAIAGKPVDVLVFVPGGAFRTIPMAALYDRQTKQFLVEKHAIAVIPALTLTDPGAIDRSNVRTLRAGLTLPVQGFPALAAVESELTAVESVFGGEALVDDAFVMGSLEEALAEQNFGIVHVATHGQFSANASDSFLLTYDGRIGLDRLAVLVERTRFRDRPIELLTLSACETAAGDDRAALGLAGVAIRAGARSALATLWTVNDQAAADLIAEFYRRLAEPGMSRAEALRRAQISLLEARPYRHPGYWSPFLLISNWM